MRLEKRTTSLRQLIALSALVALHVAVYADGSHSIFDDNWTPPPSTRSSVTGKPVSIPATVPGTFPASPPDDHSPTPAPKNIPPKSVTPAPAPVATPPAESTNPQPLLLTKYAPPDSARQAETMKLVKEVFEKEYADKAPAAKKQLAQALVGEAVKIKENYIARYVLLNEGYKAALSASDIPDCKTAIDNIDKYYTVDATALTIDTFSKLGSGPNGRNGDLANWGLEAVGRMIADDDYPQARKLAKLVEGTIPADGDASMHDRLKAAEMVAGEFERVRPSLTKLKASPDDPAANLAVGKFYCFSKHDWDRGLQMLAKGSDAKMKDLARQDLVGPSDALAQYSLAGQWWSKDKGPMQAGMRERAVYWYKKAAPNLSGLQKVLAEKRSSDQQPGAEAENAKVVNGISMTLVYDGQQVKVADKSPIIPLSTPFDGKFTLDKSGGAPAIIVSNAYVYFSLTPAARNTVNGHACKIIVRSAADCALQYDGESSAYINCPDKKTDKDGDVFVSEFTIAKASFAGRQNGGGDFRFVVPGKIFSVRIVK